MSRAGIALPVAAVALLVGCTAPVRSADPGPPPPGALFRVSAVATAADGAVLDLVATVSSPRPPDAADVALLDEQCDAPGQPTWQDKAPGALVVELTVMATRPAGARAWSRDDQVAVAFLGDSASTGELPFEATCAPGVLVGPGRAHAVAAVPGADPAAGVGGWADVTSRFGFSAGGDPRAPDIGGSARISDCRLRPGAAGAPFAVVRRWAATGPAYGCTFVP